MADFLFGTIYKGPKRITGLDPEKYYVKIALDPEFIPKEQALVDGEPALLGGIFEGIDPENGEQKTLHGVWVPLRFYSTEDTSLLKQPSTGDLVKITILNPNFYWAEIYTDIVPEETEELGRPARILVYVG